MIKRSWANADQAALVNFKYLTFLLVAAKNEVLVLKRHSTWIVHFLTIKVERGWQLPHGVNQTGHPVDFAFNWFFEQLE